jgi:hypothetical protein
MILCDTNILIEFYKGNSEIVTELQSVGIAELAVSVVTCGELYFGAKDKRELKKIHDQLSLIQQLPLDADISSRFRSNSKSMRALSSSMFPPVTLRPHSFQITPQRMCNAVWVRMRRWRRVQSMRPSTVRPTSGSEPSMT